MSAREEHCHEIVVKLCRALGRRCRVNYLAVRSGNGANRNRPCLLAPERHGRCAEAGGDHLRRSSGQIQGDLARRLSTGSSTAQTPSVEPNSVQGRIAKLERAASSCNGGCQTSFKTGNAPWVGCSFGAGESAGVGPFSLTCTDTLTYKTYLDCTSTKVFLSWTEERPGGIAAACSPGVSLPRKRSPKLMQAAR